MSDILTHQHLLRNFQDLPPNQDLLRSLQISYSLERSSGYYVCLPVLLPHISLLLYVFLDYSKVKVCTHAIWHFNTLTCSINFFYVKTYHICLSKCFNSLNNFSLFFSKSKCGLIPHCMKPSWFKKSLQHWKGEADSLFSIGSIAMATILQELSNTLQYF